MSLSAQHAQLMRTLIAETRVNGPPTLMRVEEIAGLGAMEALKLLRELGMRGFVRQAYNKGPWIPSKTLDGVPLPLQLVPRTPSFQVDTLPSIPVMNFSENNS